MSQQIPVWSVKSWSSVRLSVRDLYRAKPRFRQLGCQQSHAPGGLMCGQVLWGARIAGKQVGIAWDWHEMRELVAVMSDPMRLTTNLVLVDEAGNSMTYQASLLKIHGLLHTFDWQFEVLPVDHEPRGALRLAA